MSGLREICRGKWGSILPMVGIDTRYLTGRHGPCPICGGMDRFRFDDKNGAGTWICSKCGAGDGFSLAMQINKWDFKEAASRIEPLAGSAPRTEARQTRDEKSLRDAMNRLWQAGKAVSYGDPVWAYLRSRGLDMDVSPLVLRYVERCRYQGGGETQWFPAMVAKVTAPDGKPATLHRTYLTERGQKAPVEAARRLMPGKVEKGCAIRLAEPGDVLGIAEGIETALSAGKIFGVPCWAAVSAGMLMAWEPPVGVREVIVFGDNDESYAGQSAAYALAHRLRARDGGPAVRVELPPDPGMDWNDVVMAEQATQAA